HDDVDLSMDELRGERSELIALPRCIAMLQVHVLAFVPAQLAQALTDGGHAAAAELRREETEQAKPGDFSWRLSLGGERRKNKTDGENDRESDPPHGHLGGGWLAGV